MYRINLKTSHMKTFILLTVLLLPLTADLSAESINPLSIYIDREGKLLYLDFFEDNELIRISSAGNLIVYSSRSRANQWGGQVNQIFFFGKYSYEISYSFFKISKLSIKDAGKEIIFDYLFDQLISVSVAGTDYKIKVKYFIDSVDEISGSIPGVSLYVDLTESAK